MSTKRTARAARVRRHSRVRRKISGTAERPRLAVFRSNKHIYVQAIDDRAGRTLGHASDVEPDLRSMSENKTERAKAVGKRIAERLSESGVTDVVFDRGGFQYVGRVQALAEAAREEGLAF